MSLFGTDLGFAFNPLLDHAQQQAVLPVPSPVPVPVSHTQENTNTQVFIPPIKNKQQSQQPQYRPLNISQAQQQQQPSLPVQTKQTQQQQKSYLDILFTRKRDIMKLVILSMVIVLGISVHSFIDFAMNESIIIYKMNFKKEVILRVIYPIALFFILWNVKAFA